MFVNARTMNARHEREVWLGDLASALAQVGLEAEASAAVESDLVVRTGSKALRVRVKTAAAPSSATIGEVIAAARSSAPEQLHILVADRLSLTSRARLREAGWGWLDRRGHLRFWSPKDGVRVETEIEPLRLPEENAGYADPLATRVGLEVAVALLLNPRAEISIRGLARALGRAPSAVSITLRRLREASLITDDLQALTPELFEEVSSYWAPRRIPLSAKPMPGEAVSLERLRFNIHDLSVPGWVLTDTLAAYYYGAPVVVGTGYPPDFYVPGESVLRDATNHFGLARSYDVRECTVSVAPVQTAVTTRIDRATVADTELLLAHPLFVALELARDRARGQEILDRWDPPEEFARVW